MERLSKENASMVDVHTTFFGSVSVITVGQEVIFSGLCVHGHLSTALTAPRAFWFILET